MNLPQETPRAVRSFFNEQRLNRSRTQFFVISGVLWMFVMGFYSALAQLSLFHIGFDLFNATPPSWLDERKMPAMGFLRAFSATGMWALTASIAYFKAVKIGTRLVGASEIEGKDAERLEPILERLLVASGTAGSRPRLYVWEVSEMNAFAVGRSPKHGAIILTRGLLYFLNNNQLAGVMAHELAHLKNHDTVPTIQALAFVSMLVFVACWASLFTAIVAGAAYIVVRCIFALWVEMAKSDSGGDNAWIGKIVCIVGGFILLVYAASYGLTLILLCASFFGVVLAVAGLGIRATFNSISGSREYLADACAAQWTRRPDHLASALRLITESDTATGSTGALFVRPLMFENKKIEEEGWQKHIYALLNTHPPAHFRIATLDEMRGTAMAIDGGYSVPEALLRKRRLEWIIPYCVSTALLILPLYMMPWKLLPTVLDLIPK